MGRLELVERKETILLFLKQRGEASLAEVATHLEITKQGALRHLDALVGEGMVVAGSAARGGPGRPERRYSLTPDALEATVPRR